MSPSSARSPLVRAPLEAVTAADLAGRRDCLVVDLRTFGEYAGDHVPGACNVPLFDDVERALIGTLYARSPEQAFAAGLAAVRNRVHELVGALAEAAGLPVPRVDLDELVLRLTAGGIGGMERELVPRMAGSPPAGALVLACWRGGLRSRSVAALLVACGLPNVRILEGGYKAYRARVRAVLDGFVPPRSFVLRGLTGVGKTLVLREVEARRPGSTLDLEGLAGHRSSILGRVGLEPCTQRTFESRLVERMERGFPGYLVVEGESRKVGDIVLPAPVWDAVDNGTAIELTASTERRVAVLVADYLATETSRAELARALPFLEERLGRRKWRGELVGLLEARRDEELCELLLERYYDPLYRHSEGGRRYAITLSADELEDAVDGVLRFVDTAS